MKLLFLHLSDAHFKETTKISDININAIVSSLTHVGEFDECILVFSGDIVFSGNANQYRVAENFLGTLIKRIKERYLGDKKIFTLIVPGNHDNLAENPKRTLKDIKKIHSRPQERDDKFYKELSQLENFYGFAKRNLCFTKGNVIDVRKLTFDKFTIKINLINSAPFSLLCEANDDKGVHYFPQRELNKLDWDREENYVVSVIHHDPEWFWDESKKALYNKLYNTSNLIFVGHEHFSLSKSETVNAQREVDISSGVALYGTETEQGFNTLLLDIEKGTLLGKKFIYNGKIYKPTNNLNNSNVIFKGKNKFTITPQFKNFLETDVDERAGLRYLEYFVFPSLEAKNINDDLKNYRVASEEKFLDLFAIKSKISIEGGSRAGKTILSKYLCRMLLDEYVPLYLRNENFTPREEVKVLKYALAEQYGETADFDQFVQMDKSKKVLIVDGYDQIDKKRWNSFWNKYKDEFGHIILFCGVDWNLNIKEKTLEELTDNKIFYMKICPFYYAKREQLISKICMHFQEGAIQNIAEKVRKINDDITDQIRYFQLNPDFIHQYVDYYLNFSYIQAKKETNVFSKVFEANITFRITKHAGEENVDEIMVALDHVAQYIHFNKKYPLSFNDFVAVVTQYNEKYDNNLNPMFVYETAIKANIIREEWSGRGIEFCDENLLAYFTATHLNRIYNEGQGDEKLKYILNNICFPPNGDIVLFLSYLTSNTKILIPIMESLLEHMKEWEELSFDLENVGYLSKIQTGYNPSLPSASDKKKIKQAKEDIEKEIVEKQKTDAESLYSYDETKVNSFGNKVAKSINYLELVAKILPNFRHMLTGQQKQEIVEILYTYPNKLLYFMLKDIDDNHKRIIDDILDGEPKTKKGKLVTEEMVAKELQNQSISFILTIYDFIAGTAINNKTISDLNRKDYFDFEANTNYKLQNIMMEENAGNLHAMTVKAEKFLKNAKYDILKHMVTLVVRKFFLYHDVTITGEAQHVIDTFFGSNKEEKNKIQLLQAKNRIIKK